MLAKYYRCVCKKALAVTHQWCYGFSTSALEAKVPLLLRFSRLVSKIDSVMYVLRLVKQVSVDSVSRSICLSKGLTSRLFFRKLNPGS